MSVETCGEYRRIACLIPPGGEGVSWLGRRARALADAYGAELWLFCVVEYLPVLPVDEGALVSVDGEALQALEAQGEHHLQQWGEHLEVAAQQRILLLGDRVAQVLAQVRRSGVELLLVGSDEFAGWWTERVLVHRAQCEVLQVRRPSS